MQINTVEDFDKALAAGPYAWPGGYPLFFLFSDGDCCSFDCAKAEYEMIREAIADQDNSGWRVVAMDVNWEDENMYCAHTGERIECAYHPSEES